MVQSTMLHLKSATIFVQPIKFTALTGVSVQMDISELTKCAVDAHIEEPMTQTQEVVCAEKGYN